MIIPSSKPFIQLIGESAANTIVSWGDGASTPAAGGGTVGTFNSYTLFVQASDCALMNLTIENSFGDGSQGVALRVDGDRVIVRSCRLLGNQDTLLTNANAGLRQYFRNCYIDGNVDYIFGSARAIFDSCVIYSKDRTVAGNSFITAANTQAGQQYGYVFRNCILPPNLGNTNYFLGRPWQNSTGSSPMANNKTVFLNSRMGTSILPAGWSTWDAGTQTNLIYFGEFQSRRFDGTLVPTNSRVAWSFQLSAADAATYTDANLFGSWNPCSAGAAFCATRPAEIAVSNFRGTRVAANTVLNWNISWGLPQIKYELYRSLSRGSGYAKVTETTSADDTTYNFNLTDALPPSGSSYFYYLVASRAGFQSHVSDTLQVSNVPTINTSGTLNAFSQNFGNPSASQPFTVNGVNLTGNVTVTPPTPYEVSINGTTWFSNANPLVLTQSNGNLANTNIAVRLNAATLGSFSGTIVLSSAGAQPVNVAVTGTNAIIPQAASGVLQHWPLTTSNADSAGVRSPGVTASSSSLNRLTLSNGTTLAIVPAYSSTYGQAFGASTNGDGTWTTAVGGPGGNLTRVHFAQFTVTANSGFNVRVDSLLFAAAFYNTSSNTRVAIVYSRSGFTADSADITTVPGTFAAPISLGNQTTGTTNRYAVAFNDPNGIVLTPGQTLTFRLYFSCGSTSSARYGMLKDVAVIGRANNLSAPPPTITTNGTVAPFTQIIGAPSAPQTYSVSGSNLNGNVFVVAPAGFEISNNGGSTWNNSSLPIVLAPTSGTLAATTISVRLNTATIGAYSGPIQHISNSVSTVNHPVSGNTVNPPAITVSGALNPFVHNLGTPSATQSYNVNAVNLLGNLTITPPAGFQVSLNGTNWFTSTTPLVISPAAGAVTATIQVRMNASPVGTYSGLINHTSTSAAAQTMAVSGSTLSLPALSITQNLTRFVQVLPNASPAQSFNLTGTNVLTNVVVTPPNRYEISMDAGNTWSAVPQVITPFNGIINNIIQVRLRAATWGDWSGTVLAAAGVTTTVSIPVYGYTTRPEYTLFPNPVFRELNITHPVSSVGGVVHIYNLAGVRLASYNVPSGAYITTINVFDLPQGLYLAEYRNGDEKQVRKFVRQ